MSERFAIYLTLPGGNPVYQLASSWLGYDVLNPQRELRTEKNGLTTSPARYGFHATMKPPFRLKQGCNREQLEDALDAFCAQTSSFKCGGLQISTIGDFVALTLEDGCERLDQLAAQCVYFFEPFRARLSYGEYLKRQPDRLSPTQKQLLDCWGYPHVFDEYRFHMTLTNSLPKADLEVTESLLCEWFGELLNQSLVVDRLYLFHQPDAQARFRFVSQYKLRG